MGRIPLLRPTIWDGAVVVTVAAFALVLTAVLYRHSAQTGVLTAIVYMDGAETDRITLENPRETQRRIYHANGYTLEVTYNPDGETGVEVSASDCPTQDCVHTGRIHAHGQSIVCLPARIIIRLEGGAQNPDAPDVILR